MAIGSVVKYEQLRPGQKIHHKNGTSYWVIRVLPTGKVLARWRAGLIGRYGKEVVELTPAHVKGFRLFRPGPQQRRAEQKRAALAATAEAAQARVRARKAQVEADGG